MARVARFVLVVSRYGSSGAVLLGVFGPSPAAEPSAAEPSAAEPSAAEPSAARPSDALRAPPTTAVDAPPAAPPPGGHLSPDALEMLGKVLLEVMSIQLLGFLLKRSGAVTPVTEAGIGHYVAVIGFPCVLFSALAELQPLPHATTAIQAVRERHPIPDPPSTGWDAWSVFSLLQKLLTLGLAYTLFKVVHRIHQLKAMAGDVVSIREMYLLAMLCTFLMMALMVGAWLCDYGPG